MLRPVGSLVIPASQGSKNLSQNLSKKDSLSQDLVQPGTVEGSLAGGAGEGSLDLTRLQGADVLLTASLATSDQVPERRGGQGRAFGKRVSRRGREKRDSEEVCLHNFVTLRGGRPENEETVEPLFPVM